MRTDRVVLFVALLLVSASSAFAHPNYLEDFRRDPFRRSSVDGCNTCHMSATGGDARNPFGLAFAGGGFRITPQLRAQFPDRFNYASVRGAGGIVFHFSDPANKQMVVENGGTRMLVDVEAKSVDGNAATAPAGGATAVAASSQGSSDVRIDPLAREGAFFGMNVVNLPNGKPMAKGAVDFMIGHRFSEAISDAGLRGAFGFDSPATVAYGVRVGLSDRVSVAFMRSNMFKTIEFSSTLNALRQGDSSPVTFAVRGGVEGRQNFHNRYSPFLQPIVTRTFADRVSFTVSPTFAFNTRNEAAVPVPPDDPPFGEEHNGTIALGLGAGVRVLRSTSVVGEYIPRLWGFQGDNKDRPGVSMGLQKSTYRHTFQLVVTRQFPMTTSQYAVAGDDYFKIGFNIFRRIR